MTMYHEHDVDPNALDGAKVAVIGYGSQGRAHALNLRDSGIDVVLGLRAGGPTEAQARGDGFDPVAIPAAVEQAELVAVLIPDTAQRRVFEAEIAPHLQPGALLMFAHGFNVHYGAIQVAGGIDVGLVAPKSPGALVRRQFERGQGVPCLFAIERDATGTARPRTIAYAHGLGGTRAGILETTFAEETETDLFGEQAVLCGGATELVVAGFETLVAAGYQPEVAYFECMHELKLIVDLLYEGGLSKMHEFVSDTAKYGDITRGPRIVDERVRETMQTLLDEVRSGTFAREWLAEDESGRAQYDALIERDRAHQIESVGARLRSQMSWLADRRPANAGAAP